MFTAEQNFNPTERLNQETMIGLARQSAIQAHGENSNALGFIAHGSRASQRIEGNKPPRKDSDLDIITIRSNGDKKASEELANMLWKKIGAKYNILIDTGPWGSLEWEEALKAAASPADREKFRQAWRRLGDAPVVVGANPEIEAMVKKALFE